MTLFALLSNILSGGGRPSVAMFISAGGLCVTGVLCYVLVPNLGLTGAALATTVGGLVATGAAALAVYRQFRTVVPISSVLKLTAAALTVYVAARVVNAPLLLLPLLFMGLFGVYLLALIAVGELKRQDFILVTELLPMRLPLAGLLRKSVQRR